MTDTVQLFPGQEQLHVINFTSQLPTGITLSGTPISGAEILFGNDIASNCLNGTPIISGSTVKVPIKGSVDWVDYLVFVRCPTSNADITVSAGFLIACRAQVLTYPDVQAVSSE